MATLINLKYCQNDVKKMQMYKTSSVKITGYCLAH